MANYLFSHGKGWKFIRAVPLDLHKAYGRKYFTHYLKPMPRPHAEKAARRLAVLADEAVAVFRRRLTPQERAEIEAAGGAQKWWRSPETHMDRLLRLVANIEHDPEASPEVQEADEERAIRAERALRRMAPQIELRDTIVAKLNISDPHVDPKLFALIDVWKRIRNPQRKTHLKARLYFKRLVDVIGDLAPRSVTRAHVIAYRDALSANPKTAGGVNKHLDMIKAVFGVALSEGLVDANPAHGVIVPRNGDKHDTGRKGFTAEQTRAIFNKLPEEPVDVRWIVRLLAYEGARSGEIAQLRCKDVVNLDGILAINITDEAAGAKLKNRASLRTIPVHPAIRSEFAAFVESVRDLHGDDAWLFQSIPERKNGRGDWFQNYGHQDFLRPKIGITDKRLTMHSFRHRFRTLCRVAKMPLTHSSALMGHSEKGQHGAYGERPPLRELLIELLKINPLKG